MVLYTDDGNTRYSGSFLNPTSWATLVGANGGTVNEFTDLIHLQKNDVQNIAGVYGDSSNTVNNRGLAWRLDNNVPEKAGLVSTALSVSNASNGFSSTRNARWGIGRSLNGFQDNPTDEGLRMYRGNSNDVFGNNAGYVQFELTTPAHKNFHLLAHTDTSLAWFGFDTVGSFTNSRFIWTGYMVEADALGLATDDRSRLAVISYSSDIVHGVNSSNHFAARILETDGATQLLRIGPGDPEAPYNFDGQTVSDSNDIDAVELYLKDNVGPPYGTIGYFNSLFNVRGVYNVGDAIVLQQGDASGNATSNTIQGHSSTIGICVAPLFHNSFGVLGNYIFMRIFPDLFI